MGNNSTKQPQQYEIVSSYNNRHWFLKDHLKDCDIWENKLLNIPAEAYKIPENKSNQQLQRYTFRNINNKDIVGIYHIIYQEKQFLCSTTTTMIVLTQRIPIRLNGLERLTESQALTVLRSAYSGLNTIGAHYGPVKINEDCIGFTDDGKCKVWVNSNFSINQPLLNDLSTIENTEKLNFIRVMEVFNMVDNKTDRKCLSELKSIFTEKQPTYFEAINLIDIYCERKNLIITERINQIVVNNLFLVDRQIITENYANFNNSNAVNFQPLPVNFQPLPAKPTSVYTFQSQNNSDKMIISQPKNLTINMNWKSPTNGYSTYKPSQFFNSKPLYTPQNKTTNISFNYKSTTTSIPPNNQYNFHRGSVISNKINIQIQNQPQKIEVNKISTNPEQVSTKQIKMKEENNFKIENKQIKQISSVLNTNLQQKTELKQQIQQKQTKQIKLNQQNPVIQQDKLPAEEVIHEIQQKNTVEQKILPNIETVSKTVVINEQQTKQTSQLKEQLKPIQKQQTQIQKIEKDNQAYPKILPPVNINKNQQQIVKRRSYRERITKQQNTQPQIIEENQSNTQVKSNWREKRQVQNNIPNKRQEYQYRRTEQQEPRQYRRVRVSTDKQPQSRNFRQQVVNRVSTEKYQNQEPNRSSRRRRRQQPENQSKTYERPYSRQYKSRSRSNRYSRQQQNNQRPQGQSREEQTSQRRKYRRNRQLEEDNSKYSRSYQQSQVREISEEDLNNAPRFGRSRQRQESDIGDGRVKYSRAESIRQIKRLNEERKVLLKEREQIMRDGQLINYEQDESPAPKFGGQYNKQAQRQKELLSLNRSATEEIFSNINAEEKEQPSQIYCEEENRKKEENNLKTEQVEDQKQVLDLQNKPSESDNIDISKKLSTGVIEQEQQRPENLRDYEEYIRRKHNVPKYDRNTKTFSVSSSQKLSKAQSKEDINYDPASHSVHYQGIGNYQKGQNGIPIGSSDPIEQHPSGHHNTMTFMPKDRAAKKKQNEKQVESVRVEESRVDKLIDSEKNDTIINSVQSSQKHKVYTTQNFRRMDDGLGEQYTNTREQYGPNGFKSTTTTSYKYSSRGNLPQLKSIQSKYHKQIRSGQGQVVRSRHQKFIQTKTAMSTYDPQPFNSNSGIRKNKELINMNEELRNIF